MGNTLTPPVVPNTPPAAPADKPPAASKFWIFSFGFYLILLNLTLVYLVLRVWPEKIPIENDPAIVRIIPGHFEPSMYMEIRYLCIVGLVGALGAFIHLTTSFTEFLGNRTFVASWKWWYGLRPFIGSALAYMVYFAARGGLISGNSGAKDLSPYGIAALAGLAGMFSKQATDKLREVFEDMFKTTHPPTREDSGKKPAGTDGANSAT